MDRLVIRRAMGAAGVDVERFEGSGALQVIPLSEFYYLGGYFDRSRTVELVKQLCHDIRTRGFSVLRIAGEMSCFLEHG
jgi:hypothetical protein